MMMNENGIVLRDIEFKILSNREKNKILEFLGIRDNKTKKKYIKLILLSK